MFESSTRTERVSAARIAAVVALAGAVFVVQAALFERVVARPLAQSMPAIADLTYRVPARDDLPTFGEEIAVTAPHRAHHPTAQARVPPWRDPSPVSMAASGSCPWERAESR